MDTVLSKFGFAAFSTVPLLMVALPVLPLDAEACTAPAAATLEGSVNTAFRLEAAATVGWTRNLSPAAGVPDSTIDNPSAVSGFAARPAPANATLLPSLAPVRVYAPPLSASRQAFYVRP